ncbi:aminotransferase class III-fold pyridoxal phosphate-dependent enzyme, partial [Streptomyces sp. NPDC048659]|uniref:aminotransferase class III-fold pyridoxal phosphate-dependent enzyme n=1 Tax=Streptomyces sp. NPDC048659 TaxID=3155489 RepID=UPI0034409815
MSSLYDRHRAVIPDWVALYYRDPLEITHGEGRHVWDAEGRRYLDFFGGILTTMTAHALPEVTKAVAEQAGRIIHSSTLYLNRPMVELAERIAALSGIPDARVFFTTSGTEANDTALLLATAYRRSNQILAMRNSYHGRSFSTVGITGNRVWSPTGLSPLQTLYVHGGVRHRGPYADLTDERFTDACVADLEDLLGHTRDVAALIAEPIQGVGGFTSPPDGLYAAFRRVLDRHGILWIS